LFRGATLVIKRAQAGERRIRLNLPKREKVLHAIRQLQNRGEAATMYLKRVLDQIRNEAAQFQPPIAAARENQIPENSIHLLPGIQIAMVQNHRTMEAHKIAGKGGDR